MMCDMQLLRLLKYHMNHFVSDAVSMAFCGNTCIRAQCPVAVESLEGNRQENQTF